MVTDSPGDKKVKDRVFRGMERRSCLFGTCPNCTEIKDGRGIHVVEVYEVYEVDGEPCPECEGEGTVDEECPYCDGWGHVSVKCETCQGMGQVPNEDVPYPEKPLKVEVIHRKGEEAVDKGGENSE